ncbi:unnamed protein product, partial [Prorocentrum cordatum]
MTGAADARDAGACSPPRRDGAPSAVSTGDQSAATAAQADAWRAKLAEELGEWSWPERCLGRGYCIEVLVTEDGSTDAAQGRWVDAVPQQRVVDEAGRDAYLCAEYEWDSDPTPTGRTSGPRESDPRGPCTPSTSSCGGSARENEAGRSRSRGPSPWLRPTSCCRRRPRAGSRWWLELVAAAAPRWGERGRCEASPGASQRERSNSGDSSCEGGRHGQRADPARLAPARALHRRAPAGSLPDRSVSAPGCEGQGLPRGREVIRASRFAVLVPSPP